MTGLAAFLAARLDDDEAAALAATPGPWRAAVYVTNDEGVITDMNYPQASGHVVTTPVMSEDESRNRTDAAHIARHDPARVLREVEAGRAILAAYESTPGYDLPEGVREGRDDDERLRDEAVRDELEDVVMTLASVYRDHPDYDPAWG